MPPVAFQLLRRRFDPGVPSDEFSQQWTNPSDAFSILLILGGDVVARALAQLAASPVTPVAFSFGWVAYAVTAVVSAIGENKLMPPPGLWIIGRIVRYFETWMDDSKRGRRMRTHLQGMLNQRWEKDKRAAEEKEPGILLSFAMGSILQWPKEKWACRRNSSKTVILTRGNGSQHAIVIIGDGKGLDVEDLAAGPTNVDASTSYTTMVTVIILAAFWILLLITAAGIKQNTWFLIAVGGIGILQNISAAGWSHVIGESKVMDTLFAVEKAYPQVGRSMLATFFPGKLRPREQEKWDESVSLADARRIA
ncbi:hypothetical protein EDB80DRAFT_833937 [Ilyonectria destructans]|nr:hypothetical protein EDB80DRAFT_833937 [Ilyonectria destructans]